MIEFLYISVWVAYFSIMVFSVYITYIYFLEETESYLEWEDEVFDYYVNKTYYHLIYLFKVVTLQVFHGILEDRVEEINFWD